MLFLKDICKDYLSGDNAVHALRGVSLAFRKNEFVAILGPSGCGKTTLLNIIGGLDGYTSGDLVINGRSTKDYRDADWDAYRNHSIGFVFQSYNLIPHQSVLANVELALTISGVSKSERRARAKAALESVGLGGQLHKRPNQLSGGQMQRVAIARALVGNPDILLADEPTGALDSETSIQIMDILQDIAKSKLVIMVTHNPDLASKYATRTIRLLDGNVTSDSNPPTGDELIETQPVENRKSRRKRPSMSATTAFSLSLRNLLTKKTRTILTSFAGSIGIIGIALILSISSGLQNYIDHVEEDTLSSYPLTLQQNTIDLTGMMESMMGSSGSSHDHPLDRIYSNDIMSGMMDAMISEVTYNDLASFKEYIEDESNGFMELTNGVLYGYSTTLNVYRETDDGGVLQVNPGNVFDTIYSAMGMGMSTSDLTSNPLSSLSAGGSGMDAFAQLLENRELLDSQYDVIAGRMPENWDEIVVIVDDNNEISDYVLYTLGLRDRAELDSMIEQAMRDGETSAPASSSYSYDEILALRFRVLPTTAFFEEQPDGTFLDRSDDEEYIAAAAAQADEIKVVGILRPAVNSIAQSAGGSVGYLPSLMERLIDQVNASPAATAQLASPDTDIFTGLPFETGEPEELTMESLTAMISQMPTEQQQAMNGYIAQMRESGMSDEQILAFFSEQMASASDATYESNLAALGVCDLDSPSSISIYPTDFEAKEQIVELIDQYNAARDEADRISYTDYVGILMSSVTTIINAISYILISFVSISLIVSSIMIGIITYISVLERTKEIGILRAIGASKRDVGRVFNAETILVGFGAGAIGIGVTLLLCIPINAIVYSLTDISGIAQLPAAGGVILVLISMLLTLIAGLIPSRIAARKDPVVALRTE